MYFVFAPDGTRYGPVSHETLVVWCREGRLLPDTELETQEPQRRFFAREYLWQQQGRTLSLLVEALPALPAQNWSAEGWLTADTDFVPLAPPGNTPVPRVGGPLAHPETKEYEVRVNLAPAEVMQGTERRVQLTGFSPQGIAPQSVVKVVSIPPHIISADNPRVRYRNRGLGLPRPDGSPTDLVLLIRQDTEGLSQVQAVLHAGPKPAYPESSVVSDPATEHKTPVPSLPVRDKPCPSPCPTEVRMKISRHQATTGGLLRVVLPSGKERTVSLPPMVALRGALKCMQMGEAKPEGGNCDLRITFVIEE